MARKGKTKKSIGKRVGQRPRKQVVPVRGKRAPREVPNKQG